MKDQFSGFKKTSWVRGDRNPNYKGDDANIAAKRLRAHKYPLESVCELCGIQPACDRHHKDGDVGNNARENIISLCRKCHMETDGRLKDLITRKRAAKPSHVCLECGKEHKPTRRGYCHACNERMRRQRACKA